MRKPSVSETGAVDARDMRKPPPSETGAGDPRARLAAVDARDMGNPFASETGAADARDRRKPPASKTGAVDGPPQKRSAGPVSTHLRRIHPTCHPHASN